MLLRRYWLSCQLAIIWCTGFALRLGTSYCRLIQYCDNNPSVAVKLIHVNLKTLSARLEMFLFLQFCARVRGHGRRRPSAEIVKPPAGIGWIGIDESGKGDYFGPLVIAAVHVTPRIAEDLLALNVRDSKKISDSVIRTLAVDIETCAGIPSSRSARSVITNSIRKSVI